MQSKDLGIFMTGCSVVWVSCIMVNRVYGMTGYDITQQGLGSFVSFRKVDMIWNFALMSTESLETFLSIVL